MLILSRKLNESIIIDGKIVVKVLRIERDTVKLGIQAPVELAVHRQEIYDAIQRAKQAGGASLGTGGPPAVPVAPSGAAPGPPEPSTPPRKPPAGG
jgi:carbon storage regulator